MIKLFLSVFERKRIFLKSLYIQKIYVPLHIKQTK